LKIAELFNRKSVVISGRRSGATSQAMHLQMAAYPELHCYPEPYKGIIIVESFSRVSQLFFHPFLGRPAGRCRS
jgi:hypothetical protein